MRVMFNILPLYPQPNLRVTGTVIDTGGRPLVRRVILHDSTAAPIAETWSDAQGRAEFVIPGRNGNDRFVVRAVGHAGECDDISCPLRGVSV